MLKITKRRASCLLLFAGLVTIPLLVGCGSDAEESLSAGCRGGTPSGIAPMAEGADAYTMLLRVNTKAQVSEFDSDSLRERILDRDVFVINTQYKGMDTGEAQDIFAEIGKRFPCNRVVALNGLSQVSGKSGYMYALAGEPGVTAVMLDWEVGTWAARGTPWSEDQSVNVKRMGVELDSVANRIAEAPGAARTRVGLATQFRSGWDYAAFARRLAVINWNLNQDFLGYQLVQSQDRCRGTDDAAPLEELARRLLSQYGQLVNGKPGPNGWEKATRPQREIVTHLGFEISFSTEPKPGESLPVESDSSRDAAACTEDVLAAGGRGFIYWATPKAIEEMLSTEEGRRFRPAS